MRAGRQSPQAVALLLVLRAAAAAAAFTNDFSAYPSGAQSCLYNAADASQCDGDDVQTMNACLCGNSGNFVLAAAECIGKSDSGDLGSVYSTMSAACSYSDTPLSVSQEDFMLAGEGEPTSSSSSSSPTSSTSTSSSTSSTSSTSTSSTSTSSTSTHSTTTTSTSSTSTHSTTTTPTPFTTTVTTTKSGHLTTFTTTTTGGSAKSTDGGDHKSNDNSDVGGLSSAARIGIIVASIVAGLALLAALVFFFLRVWRKRQGGEENHPMLGGSQDPYGGDGGGGGGGGDDRINYASATPAWPSSGSHSAHVMKAGQTGGPDGNENKWPPSQDPYLSSHTPVYPLQHPSGGSVYELPVLEVPQRPAEMPATPLATAASTAYDPGQHMQHWQSTGYR